MAAAGVRLPQVKARPLAYMLTMIVLLCSALAAVIAPQSATAAPVTAAAGQSGVDASNPEAAVPLTGMLKMAYQAKCRLPSARIQFAAPAVADLDHDAYQEIVVGTTDGWVYALKLDGSDCTVLWVFDTASALNAHAITPSPTTIRQAPVVADLDGDGWQEVVVPVGTVTQETQNGGMVVLSHDGHLMPGWPKMTFDKDGDGYTEGIANSPAVVDLDGDGKLEIVVGTFDFRIWAWHADGTLVRGWPRHVFDTVWSSPAVGDLDNDGLPEVVVGVDSHLNPYYGSINGGALYAFHHDGTSVAGFPTYVKENFESTPALVDLDGDGYLDIIIGGGSYYDPGPTGYKVHAFDRRGNYLTGWPVAVGGHVTGSPAMADLDNDGRREVIVGSWDGKFYAWRFDGVPLSGWPVTPRIYSGVNYPQTSAVVANLDGATNSDGKPEIFVNSGWEVIVFDARGNQLTWDGTAGNPQNEPTYWVDWTLNATPVVADADADGKLELIAGGGDGSDANGGHATLYIWELPKSSAGDAGKGWPMFKHTPDRMSNAAPVPQNDAVIVRHNLLDQMMPGQSRQVQIVIRNTGTGKWIPSSYYLTGSSDGFSSPSRVDLPSGNIVVPGQEASFTFTITAPSTVGFYSMSWRMAQGTSPFGRAISMQVKVGNEPAYYVLRATTAAQGGGVYAGGLAKPIQPPVGYQSWERTGNMQLTVDKDGYFLLDTTGYIMWAGAAPDIGSISAEKPAVELVLGPDRQGYCVMNANGKLWAGGGAMDEPLGGPPTFNDGRIRSFAITPDYRGFYALDKYGNIYTSGTATPLSPATPVFANDLALRIKLAGNGKGYYVVDRYGRVYNGGAAPALTANYTPHLGEDWARDIELTEDERGYYLLDKFGGIHTGGAAAVPTLNLTPTWSDGTAVDLELADARAVNVLVASPSQLSTITVPNQAARFVVRLDTTLDSVALQVAADQPWLEVSTQVAATPSEVVITANPSGMATGLYMGTLQITGAGVANSPLSIPVQLRVVDHLYTHYLPQIVR